MRLTLRPPLPHLRLVMPLRLRRQYRTGMHSKRLDTLPLVINSYMLDHTTHAHFAEVVCKRRDGAVAHVRRDGRDGDVGLWAVGRGGQVGDEVFGYSVLR